MLAACNRNAVTQPTPTDVIPEPPDPSAPSYSLAGWVFDTAQRPIEGARVEIQSGPRSGEATTTAADGTFTFGTGFLAAPDMSASKDGYRLVDVRFHSAGDKTAILKVFKLGSLNPAVDFAGTYDLTFTADPACDALPVEARSRRYQTTVPGGYATYHSLVMTGATFLDVYEYYPGNTLNLSAFDNFVRLDFSDPPIWEKLASPTSLYIYGLAEGVLSGSTMDLKVDGTFGFCGVTSGLKCEQEVACHSENHTLTVTRQ
jgi:hypothetical protein